MSLKRGLLLASVLGCLFCVQDSQAVVCDCDQAFLQCADLVVIGCMAFGVGVGAAFGTLCCCLFPQWNKKYDRMRKEGRSDMFLTD